MFSISISLIGEQGFKIGPMDPSAIILTRAIGLSRIRPCTLKNVNAFSNRSAVTVLAHS